MATAKVKGNSFSLKRHASDAMDEGTMPGIALAIGENGWKSWSPSNQGALSRTKAAAPASPQDAVFSPSGKRTSGQHPLMLSKATRRCRKERFFLSRREQASRGRRNGVAVLYPKFVGSIYSSIDRQDMKF